MEECICLSRYRCLRRRHLQLETWEISWIKLDFRDVAMTILVQQTVLMSCLALCVSLCLTPLKLLCQKNLMCLTVFVSPQYPTQNLIPLVLAPWGVISQQVHPPGLVHLRKEHPGPLDCLSESKDVTKLHTQDMNERLKSRGEEMLS